MLSEGTLLRWFSYVFLLGHTMPVKVLSLTGQWMIHMPERFQTFEGVEVPSDAFTARMRLLTGDSDVYER